MLIVDVAIVGWFAALVLAFASIGFEGRKVKLPSQAELVPGAREWRGPGGSI